MTRKQRGQGGNTTYNLSNPRNVAAFEALLEEEDVEDIGKQSRASPQLPPSGRKKREKEKFFKLKSEDARAKNTHSNTTLHQQSHGTLQQLQDMFREIADPSVIVDVYQAVGSNFETAVETLLGLLGSTGAGQLDSLMLLGDPLPGFEPPISCIAFIPLHTVWHPHPLNH
jgi:hypothetical protein